jgi:hypothetical protein
MKHIGFCALLATLSMTTINGNIVVGNGNNVNGNGNNVNGNGNQAYGNSNTMIGNRNFQRGDYTNMYGDDFYNVGSNQQFFAPSRMNGMDNLRTNFQRPLSND